jgi:hypothetical protein
MMRRLSAAGEVIEDSEPEREEQRRRQSTKEKPLRHKSPQMLGSSQQRMCNVSEGSVVELTGLFIFCHRLC